MRVDETKSLLFEFVQGALTGGIAGLSFMAWLGLSAEAAIASGQITLVLLNNCYLFTLCHVELYLYYIT